MKGTLVGGPKDGLVIKHVPDTIMQMGKFYTETGATDQIEAIYIHPGQYPKAKYELTNPQGGDPVFYFVGYTNYEK